jgi:hypothetical protein
MSLNDSCPNRLIPGIVVAGMILCTLWYARIQFIQSLFFFYDVTVTYWPQVLVFVANIF